MIEIYLLQQLIAIDKEGSLSKAASSLYISQPALSRSMKKLEEELGFELFDRANGRMTLNEVGKRAVSYAKDIVTLDENMEKGLRNYAKSLRTFSYASCAPLPAYSLNPLLQQFFGGMSISSEVVEVSDEELVKRLKKRTYNLVITHTPLNDPELVQQVYFHEKIMLSVGKDSPLAKYKYLTFDMLKDTPIVIHEHIGFWLSEAKKYLPERNLMIQPQFSSIQQLLASTSLPVFYSNYRSGPESENRVIIPVREEAMEATYYLTCLQEERDTYAPLFSGVRNQLINMDSYEFFHPNDK